ncbi:uncharacterized protein LOC144473550 [Augochlora pura]
MALGGYRYDFSTFSTMTREMLVYEKYTNLVKRILKLYGLYPHQRGIVIYLPIVLLLWYVFVLCAMVNFLRLHVSEISAAVATFSVLGSLVNAGVKMTRFIVRREKLKRIYDRLETLYQDTVIKQPSGSAAFGHLFTCYRLTFSLFVLNFSAMFLQVTKPMIVIVFRNGSHAFVIPTAYPWPIASTFSYTIHYTTAAIIASSFPFISGGVDAFFTMCTFRVCSVLRAMTVELEESAKRSNDIETHRRLLRICIDRHVTLIECRDVIQEVYGPVVLSFTLTNALGMCCMIFEIFQVGEIPIGRMITVAIHFFSKVIQTVVYVWPGTMITYENEAFRDEVSFNNWYERSDAQDGKLCVTILSQRLMVLRAYNILEVTLDLFAKIMTRTISSYFLLATLDNVVNEN